MAYVYRHVRLDTNEVFYIGIGSDQSGQFTRAYSKSGRNLDWYAVTSYSEYRIDIISEHITWKEACEKEIFWIQYYGRGDKGLGILVNWTDGGEGGYGVIPTKETRQKLSNSLKGHKTSKETREKISKSNRGKSRSEEAKKKMSNASLGNKKRLGKKHSEETKKKMSEKALQRDPKSIQRMAETKKGSKNPRAKKVDQYSLDGKFIKTWSYITEAM